MPFHLHLMMLLFRSTFNELVPHPVGGYLLFTISYFFEAHTPTLTLVIDETNSMILNQIHDATTSAPRSAPKQRHSRLKRAPRRRT
ncbi:hypothetical protein TIFTF001_030439 [Ficus carica]|uniref:Secreted protein n=1 Tax=Ficus carica TaxID=3494 RepID=A0AA88DT50_FICCA|nr:hypothetical protein TIFTF001_030439 [Ficus carica]